MLDIMLCGAADIDQVRREFDEVVEAFGAKPWHYMSGQIAHDNSLTSSWVDNSRATVLNMNICVFVVVERVGDITWQTEFREALRAGKAIRIFCREDTYREYLTLRRLVSDPNAINPDKRKLVEMISELEFDRRHTIVPYQTGFFRDVLRMHLAMLFSAALEAMEKRARLSAVEALLSEPSRLSPGELASVAEIATDEFAGKTARKRAILALVARQAADDDLVRQLTQSPEQGVQRISIDNIARLYRTRPAEAEMFDHLVSVANQSGDSGLARRLIPAMLGIDFALAVSALTALDLTDIGARRRLAQELESREQLIDDRRVRLDVVGLLSRCLDTRQEADWKARCRAFVDRLTDQPP
ncbi:hypothetical protein [Amycolatopsis sp. DG1A-15b]|uniref:hypothetical protein n=1 Tax=Amycolatopsis sp. DG1A-15b TaxID=3052846 RepID=UPI00255B7B53|nr:hypothetical protein [Amycolatopsis sp. DG1A-15b]WIX92462.1 hypothetical protein QRY02_19290 [Amycolatopsis sp. DG1A-15b]